MAVADISEQALRVLLREKTRLEEVIVAWERRCNSAENELGSLKRKHDELCVKEANDLIVAKEKEANYTSKIISCSKTISDLLAQNEELKNATTSSTTQLKKKFKDQIESVRDGLIDINQKQNDNAIFHSPGPNLSALHTYKHSEYLSYIQSKHPQADESENEENDEDWVNFITTLVRSILLSSKNYFSDNLKDSQWFDEKSHELTLRIMSCFLQASNKQYANPFAYLLATEMRGNSIYMDYMHNSMPGFPTLTTLDKHITALTKRDMEMNELSYSNFL